MTEFRMPSLGADMTKGIVVEWLVGAGDRVARGDVVMLVETDKGIIEVEIWQTGTIDSIVIPAGEEVPVGALLATLSDGQRPAAEDAPRIRATQQTKVEVAGGRSGMRRAIAASMARSKREIPHYYLSTTIDVGTALEWLDRHNRASSVTERIVPAALFLKATALAATEFPEMNGHFVAGEFAPSSAVHVGVAISLRKGGLVAPAIRDCGDLPIEDVMAGLGDLVRRARNGRLRESEISSPTITVTNLGDRGVDEGYGVIIPPQVAIVCFGRIAEQPRAIDGALQVRRIVKVSLSADHRVSDGHRGGLFLESIDRHLRAPEEL